MPIQTTVNFKHDPLLQGMVAHARPGEDLTSYADVDIEFGLGLVYDDEENNGRLKVKVPDASGGLFVGVSVFDHTRPVTGEVPDQATLITTQNAKYKAGDPIRRRTKGPIQVWVEQAVTPASPVFLRHTANGPGSVPGQFRADADTANADDVSNFCRFAATTNGPSLVTLELNLP